MFNYIKFIENIKNWSAMSKKNGAKWLPRVRIATPDDDDEFPGPSTSFVTQDVATANLPPDPEMAAPSKQTLRYIIEFHEQPDHSKTQVDPKQPQVETASPHPHAKRITTEKKDEKHQKMKRDSLEKLKEIMGKEAYFSFVKKLDDDTHPNKIRILQHQMVENSKKIGSEKGEKVEDHQVRTQMSKLSEIEERLTDIKDSKQRKGILLEKEEVFRSIETLKKQNEICQQLQKCYKYEDQPKPEEQPQHEKMTKATTVFSTEAKLSTTRTLMPTPPNPIYLTVQPTKTYIAAKTFDPTGVDRILMTIKALNGHSLSAMERIKGDFSLIQRAKTERDLDKIKKELEVLQYCEEQCRPMGINFRAVNNKGEEVNFSAAKRELMEALKAKTELLQAKRTGFEPEEPPKKSKPH